MIFHLRLYFLLIVLNILTISIIKAQIPNASFENWKTVNGHDLPVNWKVNQDDKTHNHRVEKSTESVDGSYSLLMVPDDSISGFNHICQTLVSTGFNLSPSVTHDKSIFFSMKSEALYSSDTAFVRVKVEFFRNGSRVKLRYVPFYHEIKDFTLQQIPFPYFDIDSVFIEFYGAAVVGTTGLGCRWLSNIWIDNIYIDQNTATRDIYIPEGSLVYPNPASGVVNIKPSAYYFTRYKVYNLQGMLLEAGEIDNASLKLHNNGLNILVLISREGKVYQTKVWNSTLNR